MVQNPFLPLFNYTEATKNEENDFLSSIGSFRSLLFSVLTDKGINFSTDINDPGEKLSREFNGDIEFALITGYGFERKKITMRIFPDGRFAYNVSECSKEKNGWKILYGSEKLLLSTETTAAPDIFASLPKIVEIMKGG